MNNINLANRNNSEKTTSINQQIANTEQQELIDLLISKSNFHKKNWSDYEKGIFKHNWAPLFFSGFWFFAKGMLLYGVIFLISMLLMICMLSGYFYIRIVIEIALNVTLLFCANRLYFRSVKKKVHRLVTKCDNFEQNKRKIRNILLTNNLFAIGMLLVLSLGIGLLSWTNIYHDNITVASEYADQLNNNQIPERVNTVCKWEKIYLTNKSKMKKSELINLISQKILPKQTELIAVAKKIKPNNKKSSLMHNIYLQALELRLKGYQTILVGLQVSNKTKLKEGQALIDQSFELFDEYEKKLKKLTGIFWL